MAQTSTRSSSRRSPRQDPLLNAALTAAGRGWSVFPLVPGEKKPAVARWEQRATTDRRQIHRWWAPNGAGFNIGIACSPSRLVVVDLDNRDTEEPPEDLSQVRGGEDVFAMLAANAGAAMPADTYAVATPSGRHLYYRATGGDHTVRNSAGSLGWHVDIRAAGGYVVAAGSRRSDGSVYRIAQHRPVVALPQWLAEALAPPRRQPAASYSPRLTLPRGRASAYLSAILDGESRKVQHAQAGTRHNVLLTAACTLGRLVGGKELSEDEARSILLQAAASHIGVADCTDREVERTIADGIAFGRNLPRRIRAA